MRLSSLANKLSYFSNYNNLKKVLNKTRTKKLEKVTHECQGIEDVNEHGEDLPVEVWGEEGSEWAEEDDDGDADGQVSPALEFGPGLSHELTPEESFYININHNEVIIWPISFLYRYVLVTKKECL